MPEPEKQPKRILIVDDDACFVEHMLRVISELGATPIGCTDPVRAIDLIKTGDMDGVLLDIKMPEIGGLEVLERVHPKPAKTQFAIVTGYDITSLIANLLKFGPVKVFQKPISISELKGELKSWLNNL